MGPCYQLIFSLRDVENHSGAQGNIRAWLLWKKIFYIFLCLKCTSVLYIFERQQGPRTSRGPGNYSPTFPPSRQACFHLAEVVDKSRVLTNYVVLWERPAQWDQRHWSFLISRDLDGTSSRRLAPRQSKSGPRALIGCPNHHPVIVQNILFVFWVHFFLGGRRSGPVRELVPP